MKPSMKFQVITSGNYLQIVSGWNNPADLAMLFLALCRAALMRRIELGQRLEPDEQFQPACAYPYDFHMGTGGWSFHSSSFRIWRDRVDGKLMWWLGGPDARAILEAAAQELEAELKMINVPVAVTDHGMLQTQTENPCRCERCEEYRERRRIERDRSW